MSADPKMSAGARLEREAFRDYLRRKLHNKPTACEEQFLEVVLRWVNDRRTRYDKAGGGLGKK
jgi:hypothetical protein